VTLPSQNITVEEFKFPTFEEFNVLNLKSVWLTDELQQVENQE